MMLGRLKRCRRFTSGSNSGLITPSSVLALPLYKRPVFPGIVAPIVVPNDRFLSTLQVIRDGLPMNIGLFLGKDSPDAVFNNIDSIYKTGLLAQVLRVFPHKQGLSQVVIIGLHRIHATASVATDPFQVAVEPIVDEAFRSDDPEIVALTNEIILTCKEIVKLRPVHKDQFQTIIEQVDLSNPGDLADCVTGLTTNSDLTAAQNILETTSIPERMRLALALLKKEITYGEMQSNLHRQMDGSMNKTHRRFVLMEQLKSIKKELGMEADEKDVLLTKFQSRCATRQIPEAVQATINEECAKLSGLEPSSSEFAVTRNYLDWLSILPWGITSTENFNLESAKTILNDDHFGLDDVKQRIMELIAVGALKGTVNGKILCLVGPPGTGKTSIGKSIARALERKFYRFSVGGMTDVAEIKGHRRTYVGAMPGKLVQALKVTQTNNPVLLIDEIDKVGRGVSGDPGSALLEVLDPEQNSTFLDHYLDVPFDVSKVLFLVTANSLDTIPRPLLDRMEIIQLAGYVTEEKIAIAQRYLIPRVLSDCGLTDSAQITEDALNLLIRGYCREAGVRNLQKHLEKIFRKVTLNVAATPGQSVVVTADNLNDYVGLPIYMSDRYHDRTPPGVVMALAWTSHGGQTMYIESISSKSSGSPSLRTTGHLGEVMTESSNIALSFAKSFLEKVSPDSDILDRCAIHMHVPGGGTPKDGPSAGCAMVTSLLSLALNRPVMNNLAMTGEITLTGKVLRIGGVREKVIAARRSGCTDVILPIENRADFEELPEYIRNGIVPHFCSNYSDIFEIALEHETPCSTVQERTTV